MQTLRTALNANLIRHHLIISNNKQIVSSLINKDLVNDRPLLDNSSHTSHVVISKRFGRRYRKWHHWPNDFLPFYWSRQRRTPGHLDSGDAIQDIGTWDQQALILDATHSEELKNAPEVVRKQFTLEFARRKEIVNFQRHHIMKQMAWNPVDKTSPEARITDYTVKIRNFLHHFLKVDPWAAPLKTINNSLILKRKKMLKDLYYMDRDRFNFVCDTLKIDYTPPKLGEQPVTPTRKGELRRLTREYCDQIKDEKLETYHKLLTEEQKQFERQKAEVKDWIRTEEKFLGLTVNESQTKDKSSDKTE